MILAPVTTSNEQWHEIKNSQAAWGKALELAAHAQRIASQAESELRDLWNAA